MSILERVTPALVPDALAYLARRPYENVYVWWLLATGQIARGAGTLAVFRSDRGDIEGACFAGSQLVPCVDEVVSDAVLEAFATLARRTPSARGLVGPRRAVEPLWHVLRPSLGPARLERPRQWVYALTRATLRGGRRDAVVDRATRAELDELMVHSAHMIAAETGLDPRRTNADFRGRTGRIIDAGWWWRYRVLGQLAFTCNVGSASDDTAQLQGVWTPPEMRGRGYAVLGLAAICDHLLDEHPSLCLYVNDFNAPAIAVYEAVGFRRVAEFATIFL